MELLDKTTERTVRSLDSVCEGDDDDDDDEWWDGGVAIENELDEEDDDSFARKFEMAMRFTGVLPWKSNRYIFGWEWLFVDAIYQRSVFLVLVLVLLLRVSQLLASSGLGVCARFAMLVAL